MPYKPVELSSFRSQSTEKWRKRASYVTPVNSIVVKANWPNMTREPHKYHLFGIMGTRMTLGIRRHPMKTLLSVKKHFILSTKFKQSFFYISYPKETKQIKF